jgi:threonylcarbamoyladenosine tRNA methylthiotransferase MtaB
MHNRAERSKMLHTLSDKKRRAFYESQIGRTESVLWENDIEDGNMHGFTKNYVRVAAKYDPALLNDTSLVSMDSISPNNTVICQILEESLSH